MLCKRVLRIIRKKWPNIQYKMMIDDMRLNSHSIRVCSFGRIQKRIWRHGFFGFAVFNGTPNP